MTHMKRIFNILLLSVILVTCVAAQQRSDQQNDDHIRSLRIAHITDRLQLTPEESEKFWPIYNEYKTKSDQRRSKYYEYRNVEAKSDQEADELIDKMLALDQKRMKAKANLFEDLRTAISPLKIIKLSKAEHEFKKEILKRIKQHEDKTG